MGYTLDISIVDRARSRCYTEYDLGVLDVVGVTIGLPYVSFK